MQHECRITVLETKVFPELQEKYLAAPKSGPCPRFKAGDTFLLKRTPQQDDLPSDEWQVLRRGMGRSEPICLYRLARRLHHAWLDK